MNDVNVISSKLDQLVYNTEVLTNIGLFLLVGFIVIVVCLILWKVLDNFISY